MTPRAPDGAPRWLRALLARALHPRDRGCAIGDLDTEFETRAEADGTGAARRWYRVQALRSTAPALRGRFVPRATASPTSASELWSAIRGDLRLASRTLRKTPFLIAAVVISLGVGIGVVTSVFALAETVLVRAPVGLSNPSSLVTVYLGEDDGRRYGMVSWLDYEDLRADGNALSDAALAGIRPLRVDGAGSVGSVLAEVTTGNYFTMAGIEPVVGRAYTAAETSPGAPARVVVLSHRLWADELGGDPEVVGSVLRLNGDPFTVIGVAPRGLASRRVPIEPELWVPLGSVGGSARIETLLTDRDAREFLLLGRLADGATLARLQAETEVVAGRLHGELGEEWEDPRGMPRGFTVVDEAGSRINPRARALLVAVASFFLGATGLILVVTCANVAGLFLARGRRRESELAVRRSLGASRGRLASMLFVEGLVPGLAGGALGVAITVAFARFVASYTLPVAIPVRLSVDIGPAALTFAMVLSVGAASVFSLLPAWRASRGDPVGALRTRGGGKPSGRGVVSWGNGVVFIQCATVAVLLVGASLFLRTLVSASAADLGLEPGDAAVASTRLEGETTREGVERLRAARERLQGEPGVRRVAFARSLELTLFQNGAAVEVEVPGVEVDPAGAVLRNAVTPGYLELLGIPLLRGRTLDESDHEEASRVAVVNEAFQERFWPGKDALGRTFALLGPDGPVEVEVVGVTPTGRYQDFYDPPTPYLYTSLYQDFTPHVAAVVEADGPEAALAGLRRGLEPGADEVQVVPPSLLADQLSIQFVHLRVGSRVLGWGGAFGLVLAALGIYGLVSFSVSQRAREMAIRVALGARRAQVVRRVARDGLRVAGAGLVVGLLMAVPLALALRGVLWNVSPLDPASLAAGTSILAAVAVAASLIPARRITRSDPMSTLRDE